VSVVVDTVSQEGRTLYMCEDCEMLFESREEAEEHESACDADEPRYIA